ncbi:hypothetical protein BPTFM16_00831 [Altererythrobacter insulae]|nr:hypothetical protein BPTFM16_00831 [Altererythrobacter insulae]
MKRGLFSTRGVLVAATAVFLAGCQVIPKTGPDTTTGPVTGPTEEPSAEALPTDETRHRIAVLVPMSGRNGAVGQSIANAANMAILDTSAENIRITTYDTSNGAASAAAQAIADGNRLILGPMLSDNVSAVRGEAARAGVPLISFSNNTTVARPDVFVMGHIPEQSIARSVAYARARGARNFGALLPNGDYGDRAASALGNALGEYGGLLAQTQRYNRGSSAVISAANRMREAGGYDTVLIADGVQLASQGANALRDDDTGMPPSILGTELWSGESAITRTSALRGAVFSAVSNQRFQRFRDSYQNRFGSAPYRISTLGYDAVLLTLRVARDWRVGRPFPTRRLTASDGFLGLDGAFRFARNGIVERAMEVREVRQGDVVIVDAAPGRFSD